MGESALAQCRWQLEDDALVYERQRIDREFAFGELLEAIRDAVAFFEKNPPAQPTAPSSAFAH